MRMEHWRAQKTIHFNRIHWFYSALPHWMHLKQILKLLKRSNMSHWLEICCSSLTIPGTSFWIFWWWTWRLRLRRNSECLLSFSQNSFLVKFREVKKISNNILTLDLANYFVDYFEAVPLFIGKCAKTKKEIESYLYDKSTPFNIVMK